MARTPRSSPRHPNNHTCDSKSSYDHTTPAGEVWRNYKCSVCGKFQYDERIK